LISFVRGIYGLGEQSLWWDESLSHYRATKPFLFILTNRMRFVSGTEEVPVPPDNHPPFYFVLLRIVVLAAGDSEFALRFLSLAAGVLIVPLLYQCGTQLFDPRCGALSGLLGTLSPLYLWAQQEARPYALGTLLATASFYALIRILHHHPSPTPVAHRSRMQRVREMGWQAAYLLSAVAMLITHYQSLLLLAAQAVIVLVAQSHRRRRLLWAPLIASIVAVAVFAWGLRMMPRQASIPGYEFITLGTLLHDVLRSFPLGISGTGLALFQWVGTGLLSAAFVILIARGRNTPWQHTLYLYLCFLMPIGEIYALSFVRPAYMNVRHLIFASPFYYLLLAASLSQARHLRVRLPLALSRSRTAPREIVPARRAGTPRSGCRTPRMRDPGRAVLALLSLAMGILLVGMVVSTYTYLTGYAKEDHRGWGRYLSDHIRPDDFVLINPGAISELYFYYVESEVSWYGFPLINAGKEQTIAQLQEIMNQHDRVWVAQSLTPHWANPGNVTLEWLRENALRIAFADFYSASTTVQAHAFRLKPPLLERMPESVSPVALDFDDQLHLLGLSSPMEHVAAGHTLQLSLYWSATRPLNRDYRVTLSLSDDTGISWTSLDYAPTAGAYPTSQWAADRIVRDDVDLDVPPGVPPGSYRLKLSVYPADQSSSALAVRDLDNGRLQGLIVPIGRVKVVPPEKPPLNKEIPITYKTARCYGDMCLLGHDYGGGAYQPGDVVRLAAYWRAIRTPRQNPSFSLQLIDENGATRAARAVAPAGDYLPVQWSKREVVKGRYSFRIPIDVPPGQYSLCLAPEDEREDWRWPWKGGRVTLNTLTVHLPTDERSFEIPPMQAAIGAVLGDQVELLGLDLASETIRPGQVVSCTLYWRAFRAMNQNYTVFNHLIAPDGQTWGQWDNQPLQGRAPTTRWVPGQVIADPYRIPVSADAPAGPLELRVGMYDLLTMARLPVYDKDGNPVGDSIAVTGIEVTGP